MARHAKAYEGERFTEKVTLQLTPTQRAELEKAARAEGLSLSRHAREMCLRRSAAAQIVAGTRRNPNALALINELTAVGNNLNQLTRLANTLKTVPQQDELRETTTALKAAFARILAL